MAQASHIGLDLREVNAEADTLNTSPTSDLSGSTLVTSLSSSGAASFESVLLQAAEEISLEARKSDYCFSPLVHYDDHYYDIVGFQEGEYEQRQLVEAAEQSSVEACCPSPLIYYDCLYHDYLDFQESEYEQQQLIEAAEREEMTSKTENRAMSPSSHYEAPSPPSERGPPPLHSSHLSQDSPFSPTRISMGGDERQARPRRVIPHTATYRTESRPQLRHPFIDTAAQSELNAASTQSFSGFPDSAHSDRSGQDAQSVQAQANIPIPNVALTISSESSNSRNTSPDLGGKPSPIPILNSGKPPRPPKRSQANTPLEYDDGKAKRVRVHPDVYDIPISPEPNGDLQPTFSTATTAVSSQSGSPNLSAPIDFEQVTQIMMKIDDKTKIFICHEYKLLQISSFVQAYRNTHRDQMLKLKPQSQVSGIKPQTIHLFLHWLYSNQFTEPGEESCGFSELLELYCFGQVYGITVLKNTVIDHLIEKCSVFCIPARCTRRIYKYTEPGDQLRKLWVDIYVWEVTEERFKDELRSGKLDPTFLRDLALAQMYKIRSIQKQSGGPGGFSPPYEKSKEAYHKPDAKTGVCCSRRQYEGEEGHHDRGFHEQEAAKLRTMLEKVRVKLDSLKRKESQNSSLRRNLHKMQLKLSKAEMMVKTHVSIDHSKLLKVGAWDNPEVNHPEVMRRQKVVTRLQH